MKAVTTYVTSDNKSFTDEALASAHERDLGVVVGVKAMLTANGKAITTKNRWGNEVTRFKGLKQAMKLIGDWEAMKAAPAAPAAPAA